MSKPELTPTEKHQAFLRARLEVNERKIVATEAAIDSALGREAAILRQLRKELKKEYDDRLFMLLHTDHNLDWERVILRPLTLHLHQLGQQWSGQAYSKLALKHLTGLGKLSNAILKLYSKGKPAANILGRVESFIDAAPVDLGVSQEVNAIYPHSKERCRISDQVWNEILSAMGVSKAQVLDQYNVHNFTSYLQMYRGLALCVDGVLDGSLIEMRKGIDAEGGRNAHILTEFIHKVEDDDDYKENQMEKLALLECEKLRGGTARAKSTHKSRRL